MLILEIVAHMMGGKIEYRKTKETPAKPKNNLRLSKISRLILFNLWVILPDQ
jgi:hypothetical protein